MKRKRIKFSALLLSALMLLTFASCSDSKKKTEEISEETAEETTAAETEESVTKESTAETEPVSGSGVLIKTSIDDYEPFVTSADQFAPSDDEIYTMGYSTGTDYVPSDNNKLVFPYIARRTDEYWPVYGLVNEKGELLTPGIYAEIIQKGNVYILVGGQKHEDRFYGDYTFGLINKDGSKYTGCIYQHCYYKDGQVTFYNCNNGIIDLYTYNDDLEIVSTKQLKYDSSIPCNFSSEIRFFMEGNKFSMLIDNSCYIFNSISGEKLAEYPYYGMEGSIVSNLIEKSFGYYYDINCMIDEDCNISEPTEDFNYYRYMKVDKGIYYDQFENRYVDEDLETIITDHDSVEYIGDGYYLVDFYYVMKPGEEPVLDMSDSLMCGAIGIFDDGSDNYFLIGDTSFDTWNGVHISIPKSELIISEDDLWAESDSTHLYENGGVRAVVKDSTDPYIGLLARESCVNNLDNANGNRSSWHMSFIEGYTADEYYEDNYCTIADKDGNIVFKKYIVFEE